MAEVHHSCELRMFVHSVRRRATWNKRQTGKTWMDLVESLRMNEILHQICRLVLDLFPTAQIQSILHCAPRFSSSIFFLLSSFLCFCRNFGVWAFEPISPLWVWSFLLSLFLPYSLPFFVVFFCGLHLVSMWSPGSVWCWSCQALHLAATRGLLLPHLVFAIFAAWKWKQQGNRMKPFKPIKFEAFIQRDQKDPKRWTWVKEAKQVANLRVLLGPGCTVSLTICAVLLSVETESEAWTLRDARFRWPFWIVACSGPTEWWHDQACHKWTIFATLRQSRSLYAEVCQSSWFLIIAYNWL